MLPQIFKRIVLGLCLVLMLVTACTLETPTEEDTQGLAAETQAISTLAIEATQTPQNPEDTASESADLGILSSPVSPTATNQVMAQNPTAEEAAAVINPPVVQHQPTGESSGDGDWTEHTGEQDLVEADAQATAVISTATGPSMPEIVSFTVDPVTVDWDQTLTVSWEVHNATYVNITLGRGASKYHELFWSRDGLSPTGSLQVSADLRSNHHAFGRHASDRYINLVAHSVNADSTSSNTAYASLDIFVRCPYPLFFGRDPSYPYQADHLYTSQGGCGNSTAYSAQTVYQTFENGAMMKVEVRRPTGTVTKQLVLYDNGGVVWYGTPQSGDLPASPDTLYPPGSHLADLWNGYIGDESNRISEDLGWATAAEQVYSATIQLGASAIYVALPDGRIMRFAEASSEPTRWQQIIANTGTR